MPLRTAIDLWQLLTYSAYGAAWAAWGLLLLLVGLKVGENRGYAKAPEKHKAEWREEHNRRLVAEARAEAAEKAALRLDVALQAMAQGRDWYAEPRGLRVEGGRG